MGLELLCSALLEREEVCFDFTFLPLLLHWLHLRFVQVVIVDVVDLFYD